MTENEELIEVLKEYRLLNSNSVIFEQCIVCNATTETTNGSRLCLVSDTDMARRYFDFCDCCHGKFIGYIRKGDLHTPSKPVSKPVVNFEPVSFDDVPKDETDFIEKLREKEPAFVKRLASFLAGDITFDDGEENEFLKSVAEQVTVKIRNPTPLQIEKFRKVYDLLLAKKSFSGTLHKETTEELEMLQMAAVKLVGIGCKRLHLFTPKTREIVTSMADQLSKKGSLSAKQVKFLRMIVEQLPPAMLEEREEDPRG